VVPSQKFVNIIIRNSLNLQVFEDSQTLLALSSVLLGVSWPRDPWFDPCLDELSEIFLKGGPEPLDKEINEIFGSKREDRLLDPFFELVQNICLVRFSYMLRLCNFCKAPRDMPKFSQKCQKIVGC